MSCWLTNKGIVADSPNGWRAEIDGLKDQQQITHEWKAKNKGTVADGAEEWKTETIGQICCHTRGRLTLNEGEVADNPHEWNFAGCNLGPVADSPDT